MQSFRAKTKFSANKTKLTCKKGNASSLKILYIDSIIVLNALNVNHLFFTLHNKMLLNSSGMQALHDTAKKKTDD